MPITSTGGGYAGLSAQALRPAQARPGTVLYLPVVNQERAEPFEIVSDMARARSLDASGSRAFVATGRSVLVLDIADRENERPIGRSPILPGRAVDVAVDGNRMAVTVQIQRVLQPLAGAIVICDIADGKAPRILGIFDVNAPPEAIAIAGDTVFLAGHAIGLWTVDIAEPSAPKLSGLVGRFVGQDIVVEDETVYVVGSQALHVVDVADVSAPVIVGSVGGLGTVLRLEVAGGRAYVAEAAVEEAFNGVRIIDVSDRRSPAHVTEVAVGGTARQVAVEGDLLYVLSLGRHAPFVARITVYDLAEPDQPAALARLELPQSAINMLVGQTDMEIEKGKLLTHVTSSVIVVDLGLSAKLSNPRSVLIGDVIQAIGASGHTVAMATWEALEIVDFGDPGLPRRMGRLAYGDYPEIGHVRDLALGNDFAYAVGYALGPGFVQHPVLVVFDVRAPHRPRRLATLDLDREYHELAVAEDTVYLLRYDELAVVDVADPEVPRIVTRSRLAAERESLQHLALGDGRAIVTSSDPSKPLLGRIATIDVSDRSMPVVLGSTRFPEYPADLALAGDRAYVSTTCGVQIFDIGAKEPRREGSEPDCSRHRDLRGPLLPMDDHVLTVMPGGVIREVDVRKPEAPRQRSSARLPEAASELIRMDGYILAVRSHPADYLMVVRYLR